MTKSNPQRTFAKWVGCGVMPVAIALFLGVSAQRCQERSRYGSDGPHSGWSARWVDDVDSDGTPDFVLSTPFDPHHPSPRLISGSSGRDLGVRSERRVRWDGRASPGDLDGDGEAEAWEDSRGGLVLWSSKTHALNRTFRADLSGLADVLDDLDGDGVLDLLIGGFPARGNKRDRVSAVSTRTGAALWTVERRSEPGSYISFAWNGCVVGDIDGDGVADAAVQDEREHVEFLSGRDGSTIGRAESRCDGVTGSLSPLDDLDGDGRPEVLAYGGWNDDVPTEVVACVDGRVLRTLVLPRYARDVFSPGDVDGDGLRDVAWSTFEVSACVRASDGSPIGQWPGVQLMPCAGDHDRDGHADLLAVRNVYLAEGSKEPDDLWRQGRVEIISGKTLTVVRVFDADALGLPR